MPEFNRSELIKTLDQYLTHRRRLYRIRSVYNNYLATLIAISALEFLFPLLLFRSMFASAMVGFLLLGVGVYAFMRLYGLARIMRYEAISLEEAEMRMITDYGLQFDLRAPDHFMRYFEIAEKLEARPARPDQGILIILLIAFSGGVAFWVLALTGGLPF
jgi:hypothetical protein